jgi:hypothetical protein
VNAVAPAPRKVELIVLHAIPDTREEMRDVLTSETNRDVKEVHLAWREQDMYAQVRKRGQQHMSLPLENSLP